MEDQDIIMFDTLTLLELNYRINVVHDPGRKVLFFICKTINKIQVGFEYLRKKYEF